jgi:hypothetical protein
LQLAREGAATTSQHLARFDDPRRFGTLVAVLLEARSTLTDDILDRHDRWVGDFLGLLSHGFAQMRRYTSALLDTFEFRAAPAARPLLKVIESLRAMNQEKSRAVPQHAPLEWINPRWKPYVVTGEGNDRRFDELCALTELKNRLRSGDVWVTGNTRCHARAGRPALP